MRTEYSYPLLYAIADSRGSFRYELVLNPEDDPELLSVSHTGELLAEFINQNLGEYKAAVENTAAKIAALSEADCTMTTFRDHARMVMDTAALLQSRFECAYYFSMTPIEALTSDASYDGSTKGNAIRKLALNRMADMLFKVARLQHKFRFGMVAGLAKDDAPADIDFSFEDFFAEYHDFSWKTSAVIVPMKKGRLVKGLPCMGRTRTEQIRAIKASGMEAGVAQCHIIETLDELLYFELMQAMAAGIVMRRCKLCNRYFVLGDPRRQYCDHLYANEKTCRDVGPGLVHQMLTSSDPYLRQYRSIKDAMYIRTWRADSKLPEERTGRDIGWDEYSDWEEKGRLLREQYLAGKVLGEDFITAVTPKDYTPRE